MWLSYLCPINLKRMHMIPKRVFYKEEFDKEFERLKRKVDAAKTAWKELQAMPDFQPVLPHLDSLSEEAVRKVVHDAQMSILASWMPCTEKEKAVEQWRQLGLKAYSLIRQIQNAVEVIKFTETEDGHIEPAEDIKAKATELATKDTPEKAFEYYDEVVKALEAVKVLREYEAKNDLPSIFLQQLEWLTEQPEKFAREWITGTFSEPTEQEKEARTRYGWKRPNNKY